MSRVPKYSHHRLNIHLAEKAVAEEVSAEADIKIEFKEPRWFGAEKPVEDMVGVYCGSEKDAAWFKRAFGLRRWEDGKSHQGE